MSCFANIVSCFGRFALCFANSELCFNNTVLCFDNIVMCFDNTVLCFDNSLLCSDNTMLCLEKCLLCFKNCLLCLQIWATVDHNLNHEVNISLFVGLLVCRGSTKTQNAFPSVERIFLMNFVGLSSLNSLFYNRSSTVGGPLELAFPCEPLYLTYFGSIIVTLLSLKHTYS